MIIKTWFWKFVRNINCKAPFPSYWIRNSEGRARKLCFHRLSGGGEPLFKTIKLKSYFKEKGDCLIIGLISYNLISLLHTWRTPKRKESEAYWVNIQGRPCFHFLIGHFLILHFLHLGFQSSQINFQSECTSKYFK